MEDLLAVLGALGLVGIMMILGLDGQQHTIYCDGTSCQDIGAGKGANGD